jgi:hypothetical protein
MLRHRGAFVCVRGVNPAVLAPAAMSVRLCLVPLLALLAACGPAPASFEPPEMDPAVAQALADQLMVDPDLVGQNEAGAALTGGTDQSVPLEVETPEAIREAQRQAAALLRGSGAEFKLPAPGPLPESQTPPLALLTDEAARLPDAAECLGGAHTSAIWAARLPAALPVYPRGATQEALGSDAPRCALRAVRFTSPVPAQEIVRFYHARARAAGLAPRYRAGNGEHRIEGGRGAMRFTVHLRPHLSGTSEVDLVVITG